MLWQYSASNIRFAFNLSHRIHGLMEQARFSEYPQEKCKTMKTNKEHYTQLRWKDKWKVYSPWNLGDAVWTSRATWFVCKLAEIDDFVNFVWTRTSIGGCCNSELLTWHSNSQTELVEKNSLQYQGGRRRTATSGGTRWWPAGSNLNFARVEWMKFVPGHKHYLHKL